MDPLSVELGIFSAMRSPNLARPDSQINIPKRRRASLWQPGQSGNPKGPPLTTETWRACVRRVVNGPSKSIAGATRKEAIIEEVTKLAQKGVAWAVEFLADRDDGKATQFIDVTAKRNPLEGVSDEELRAALELVKGRGLLGGSPTEDAP